jgi:mannose-1-phosphate guanylyltransferase
MVCPLDVTWSDIGSWAALDDVLPHDVNGNILKGDTSCIDTQNSMIRAEHRLVATLGVQDLIIIETEDVVMVAHKDHAQKVKDMVAQLKIQQRKGLT